MKENRLYKPQPPREPTKPERVDFNFRGAGTKTTFYSDMKVLHEDLDLGEYFDGELPTEPAIPYDKLTLQDVVDMAPSGAELSDIKLGIYYPRMMEYMDINFIHHPRNIEVEESVFQQAMTKYEADYTKYQEDMKAYEVRLVEYDEWNKQLEIQKLKDQLSKLES
jgi:hypothetical protein